MIFKRSWALLAAICGLLILATAHPTLEEDWNSFDSAGTSSFPSAEGLAGSSSQSTTTKPITFRLFGHDITPGQPQQQLAVEAPSPPPAIKGLQRAVFPIRAKYVVERSVAEPMILNAFGGQSIPLDPSFYDKKVRRRLSKWSRGLFSVPSAKVYHYLPNTKRVINQVYWARLIPRNDFETKLFPRAKIDWTKYQPVVVYKAYLTPRALLSNGPKVQIEGIELAHDMNPSLAGKEHAPQLELASIFKALGKLREARLAGS